MLENYQTAIHIIKNNRGKMLLKLIYLYLLNLLIFISVPFILHCRVINVYHFGFICNLISDFSSKHTWILMKLSVYMNHLIYFVCK